MCTDPNLNRLWFDVGIKRYTTHSKSVTYCFWLWFDVGIKRYTTEAAERNSPLLLWFDVGIKRYTTILCQLIGIEGCGLM